MKLLEICFVTLLFVLTIAHKKSKGKGGGGDDYSPKSGWGTGNGGGWSKSSSKGKKKKHKHKHHHHPCPTDFDPTGTGWEDWDTTDYDTTDNMDTTDTATTDFPPREGIEGIEGTMGTGLLSTWSTGSSSSGWGNGGGHGKGKKGNKHKKRRCKSSWSSSSWSSSSWSSSSSSSEEFTSTIDIDDTTTTNDELIGDVPTTTDDELPGTTDDVFIIVTGPPPEGCESFGEGCETKPSNEIGGCCVDGFSARCRDCSEDGLCDDDSIAPCECFDSDTCPTRCNPDLCIDVASRSLNQNELNAASLETEAIESDKYTGGNTVTGMIAGVIVGFIVLLFIIIGGCLYYKRSKKYSNVVEIQDDVEGRANTGMTIQNETDNVSNIIVNNDSDSDNIDIEEPVVPEQITIGNNEAALNALINNDINTVR